jgi:hypothetical protein
VALIPFVAVQAAFRTFASLMEKLRDIANPKIAAKMLPDMVIFSMDKFLPSNAYKFLSKSRACSRGFPGH